MHDVSNLLRHSGVVIVSLQLRPQANPRDQGNGGSLELSKIALLEG